MAPVLLDQNRLLLIFASILLVVISAFTGGYYVGVRVTSASLPQTGEHVVEESVHSDGAEGTLSEPEALEPAEVGNLNQIADSHIPPVPDAQLPDTDPVVMVSARVQDKKPGVTGSMESHNASKPGRLADSAPETMTDEPLPETLVNSPEAVFPTGGPITEATDADQHSTVAIIDDATAEDALYSIQVAIYGSLNNAQQHVDELSALHLSAYHNNYHNKDGKVRYNVRFGHFASRASAVTALEIWKQEFPKLSNGSYVVRLLR